MAIQRYYSLPNLTLSIEINLGCMIILKLFCFGTGWGFILLEWWILILEWMRVHVLIGLVICCYFVLRDVKKLLVMTLLDTKFYKLILIKKFYLL